MGILTKIYDTWSSRAANAAALWPLIPSGIIGIMTGIGSQSIDWISQYGWFGWWCAFLMGFLITAIGMAGIGYAREKFAIAFAQKKWSQNVDTLNPLESVFSGKRISIRELAHPISKRIIRKTFRDCELVGPENVIIVGGAIEGVNFMNCEFVIVRGDARQSNVKVFDRCHVIGGDIWECTIFLSQDMFNDFKKGMPNIEAITYEKPDD